MALNSNPNSGKRQFLQQQSKVMELQNLTMMKESIELRQESLNKERQEVEFLLQEQQQQPPPQQQQKEEVKWRDLLPTGYRFKPTDEELLEYLYAKLCGLPIRHGIIADVDVYEYFPSSLKERAFDAGDEVYYFFTALKRKHLNGMRPSRATTVGGGYWRTTSKPIVITISHCIDPTNSEAGNITIIAVKRSLVYTIGKPSEKGEKTNWIMHEYTIKDVKPPQQPNQWNKYIVCSIYHRQTRAGDSAESSLLGKRKQQEQQTIDGDFEIEGEELVDNGVHRDTKRR